MRSANLHSISAGNYTYSPIPVSAKIPVLSILLNNGVTF